MVEKPIRVAVQIAQYGAPWPDLLTAAQEADELGFDALFNWDHFFGPGRASDAEHLECWTVLAAWAASTSRIALGPLVSSVGYRNPDLVADMARTIDHISGGRFVLGMGAGFKERDFVEYGYDFGTPAGRIDALADGLERIRKRLERLHPQPLHPIPILVGGSGEKRTLPVVARHADIWHTFAEGDDFERKSRILDDYCREIGRDPGAIERSVLVEGDPLAVGRPLRSAGATLFVVNVAGRPNIDLAGAIDWLRWRDAENARLSPG